MPPKAKKKDVHTVLQDATDPPVRSASMIADEMCVSKPTAITRLNGLVEDGLVEKSKIGQTNVYWDAESKTDIHKKPVDYDNAHAITIKIAGERIKGWFVPFKEEIEAQNVEANQSMLERLVPW